MPHLVLETCGEVLSESQIQALLEDLVEEFSGIESVSPGAVKARWLSTTRWQMGEGAPPAFVHCEVRVLSGRSPELLAQMKDQVYECMLHHVKEPVEKGWIALSVEVRTMDKNGYRKS